MEFIPKDLSVWVSLPPEGPDAPNKPVGVTRDVLNRIWAEVTSHHPSLFYTLQIAIGGDAGQFRGATEHDLVMVEPPVLQVNRAIDNLPVHAAIEAQDILRTIAKHTNVNQLFNLGISLFYNVPTDDARREVLHGVLARDETDIDSLRLGGEFFGSLRYVATSVECNYDLRIEPLFLDNKFIHIGITATFAGPVELNSIDDRVSDVDKYVRNNVGPFLDARKLGG